MTGKRPPRTLNRPDVLHLVAMAAIMAVLVGTAVGVAAGQAARGTDPPTTTTPAVALPDFDADFPNLDKQYLDVAISQLRFLQPERAMSGSWSCDTRHGAVVGSGYEELTCGDHEELQPAVFQVVAEYFDDETQVTRVEAHCDLGPGNPECVAFFAEAGRVVFTREPTLEQEVGDWIIQHADSDDAAEFADILVQVSLEPASVTFTPTA